MKLEDIVQTIRADITQHNTALTAAAGKVEMLAITYDRTAASVVAGSVRMESAVIGAYSKIGAGASGAAATVAAAGSGVVATYQGIAAASTAMANTVLSNMARISGGGYSGGVGRVAAIEDKYAYQTGSRGNRVYQTGYTTNSPDGGAGAGYVGGGGSGGVVAVPGGGRMPPGDGNGRTPIPGLRFPGQTPDFVGTNYSVPMRGGSGVGVPQPFVGTNYSLPLPGRVAPPGPFNVSGSGLDMLRDRRTGFESTHQGFSSQGGSLFGLSTGLQHNRGRDLGHSAFFNPAGKMPDQNSEPWRWNWGAAAGAGMFGRILGGPTAGMMGALGGGLGGAGVGAVAAGAGIGLNLVMKPIEIAAHGAVAGLHMIAEGGKFLLTKITELGASFERTQAVFSVIAGSPTAGNELLKKTREMAVLSPYTSQQLYPRMQMLLGMGVNASEAPSVMSRLGDIAGGDNQRLGRLALAYGQSQAAGRLVGYELRQFTEAGVGVGDFAQAAGMKIRDFRDAMHRGEIGPEVVGNTLNMLTGPGGRFQGLSSRINQTVGGQHSALTERLQMTGEEFGVKAFSRIDLVGRMERLGLTLDKLKDAPGNADKFADAIEKGAMIFDALYGTIESIANANMMSWEQFMEEFDKFGKNTLPEIVGGVQILAGTFMRFLSGSIDIIRSISGVVATPLGFGSMLAKIPTPAGGFNPWKYAGLDTLENDFSYVHGKSGELSTWLARSGAELTDPENVRRTENRVKGAWDEAVLDTGTGFLTRDQWTEWYRTQASKNIQDRMNAKTPGVRVSYIPPGMIDREAEALEAAGGANFNAYGGTHKRAALRGIRAIEDPLLSTFARAYGINKTGFDSPPITAAVGMDRWMGISPADREFQEDLAKRTGIGAQSQYDFSRNRIERLLSKDVGPLSRLLGAESPMSQESANFALKEAAEKLKKALEIPVDPLEKFTKRMEELDRAGRGAAEGPFRLYGRPGLGQNDVVMGKAAAIEERIKAARDQFVTPAALPTTRYAGSVEAVDVLNQSIEDTRVWQRDLKALLEAAAKMDADKLKAAQKLVDQFNKLNQDKVVVQRGEER